MSPELPDPGFLREARAAGATDLTVTLGQPVRARAGDTLLTLGRVSAEEFARFGALLCRPLQPLEVGTFTCQGDRLRYVYYLSESGPTFELRHLPASIPALPTLGLPPAFLPLTRRRSGLIIVTGATGSGKSTTLAAVIDDLNRSGPGLKIVTLEDPIEYLHPERNAVVRQCEYRRDFPDFPAAIRALLRQNPDVALVGELRDEIRRGLGQGMVTMDDSLAALCRRRAISREAALGCAHNREDLRRKLEPHRP